MALRGKTLTKAPDPEEPAQELFSQRRKPESGNSTSRSIGRPKVRLRHTKRPKRPGW